MFPLADVVAAGARHFARTRSRTVGDAFSALTKLLPDARSAHPFAQQFTSWGDPALAPALRTAIDEGGVEDLLNDRVFAG
jgi:hypothetical protein